VRVLSPMRQQLSKLRLKRHCRHRNSTLKRPALY